MYKIELINDLKDEDIGIWEDLAKQFQDTYILFNESVLTIGNLPSVFNESQCTQKWTVQIGRPSYIIPVD